MRYETLDNLVSHYLIEAGLGEAEYTRAYHIGMRGLQELQIDFPLHEVHTTELWITPNGLGELPEDCHKVLSISRRLNGQLVPLTREKNLSKLGGSCGCGNPKACRCKAENVTGRPENIGTNPYHRGGSYGVGSWKDYGKYYITGHTVYLSPNLAHCSGEIFIEYKAFPKENETGEPYVHPYVREALIAYIRWIYAINRKNQDKWDKQYYEKEWHRLKANAKYRMKAPTKQELNQVARRHVKFGLKS